MGSTCLIFYKMFLGEVKLKSLNRDIMFKEGKEDLREKIFLLSILLPYYIFYTPEFVIQFLEHFRQKVYHFFLNKQNKKTRFDTQFNDFQFVPFSNTTKKNPFKTHFNYFQIFFLQYRTRDVGIYKVLQY